MIENDNKREMLKLQLDGQYEVVSYAIFQRVGKIVQKLTRRTELPPLWASATIFNLVVLLVGLSISLLVDNGDIIFLQKIMFYAILNSVLATVVTFAINVYVAQYFKKISGHVLDAVIENSDIADLQKWFSSVTNQKWQWATGICFVIISLLAFSSIDIFGSFPGFGFLIIGTWVYFLGGLAIYFIIVFISFPLRISKYQFNFFGVDPRNSMFIGQLSSMFNNTVLIFAIVAAVITGATGSLTSWISTLVIANIFVDWIPTITLFVINQTAINRIIANRKRQKLAEIQDKIVSLEGTDNSLEKDKMEGINRLLDYHERILKTRNSALDFRSILNFVNSLLLVVVGSSLKHIDVIFEFLSNLFR